MNKEKAYQKLIDNLKLKISDKKLIYNKYQYEMAILNVADQLYPINKNSNTFYTLFPNN
jgi:hypothetical protein